MINIYKQEHNIQSLIMIELSKLGYIPLRANAGQFWQGQQATIDGQRILTNIKAVKGMPEGTSDIICIMPNGRTAWIECKTATGKQREAQIRFQQIVESLGHKYYIMRSVEDISKLAE